MPFLKKPGLFKFLIRNKIIGNLKLARLRSYSFISNINGKFTNENILSLNINYANEI
jgi:hypothetical protein